MHFPKLIPVFLSIASLLFVSEFRIANADHGGYHALPKIIIQKPNIPNVQRRTLPRTVIGDACQTNLNQRCPPGYACRHIKRPDQRSGTPTIDPEYACVYKAGDASCPPGFTIRMDNRQTGGRVVSFTCTSSQMVDPMQWCASVEFPYMGYYVVRNEELEFICGRDG